MSLVSIIYYISISQNQILKELWKLYIINKSRIYLHAIEFYIENEFKKEI